MLSVLQDVLLTMYRVISLCMFLFYLRCRANHILFYTKVRSSKALVLNFIIRIVSAFKCSLYSFNTFYSNEVVNVFTSRHVR